MPMRSIRHRDFTHGRIPRPSLPDIVARDVLSPPRQQRQRQRPPRPQGRLIDLVQGAGPGAAPMAGEADEIAEWFESLLAESAPNE